MRLVNFAFTVDKRQRKDEIRTGDPTSKWNHSATYESVFICLAYLKGLKKLLKNM